VRGLELELGRRGANVGVGIALGERALGIVCVYGCYLDCLGRGKVR
jgi:hypothetical protein